MFRRAHYEAVAKVLKETRPDDRTSWDSYRLEWEDICTHFADMFQRDNPSFKKAKFLVACGVGS